jgi:hypothetical protein
MQVKATGAAVDPDLMDGCSMDSQMDRQGTTSLHVSLLQELEQLMDPTFTNDSNTAFLLLRMTTEETRIYAQTSLGQEAGNVWVFLDFLKDEQDKWSGIVDMALEQSNKDSLTTPWQHLPP